MIVVLFILYFSYNLKTYQQYTPLLCDLIGMQRTEGLAGVDSIDYSLF